jgi:hypothetical protein
MGLFDSWSYDPAITDGSYGSPGYGVLANSGDSSWLNSVLDAGQFSGVPYAAQTIDPYSGMPIDMGVNPYAGQTPTVSTGNGARAVSSGGTLKNILGGLGGLAAALGPALQAAGRLASGALDQQPFYRPIPTINAPGARTEGGAARPLDLGGQATKISPLDNYVKLIQGLR